MAAATDRLFIDMRHFLGARTWEEFVLLRNAWDIAHPYISSSKLVSIVSMSVAPAVFAHNPSRIGSKLYRHRISMNDILELIEPLSGRLVNMMANGTMDEMLVNILVDYTMKMLY